MATDVMGPSCTFKVSIFFPLSKSHTVHLPSYDPHIARLPSGVIATQLIILVCPSSNVHIIGPPGIVSEGVTKRSHGLVWLEDSHSPMLFRSCVIPAYCLSCVSRLNPNNLPYNCEGS